mmetsp:Transcript_19090/g.31119  ORF Transcript_19090/g.31119 Transcript_19090/m.31119 type:complete len:249 (-) Transcript_19090:156-902(-)
MDTENSKFHWTPSHCDCKLHDKVDKKAKKAAMKSKGECEKKDNHTNQTEFKKRVRKKSTTGHETNVTKSVNKDCPSALTKKHKSNPANCIPALSDASTHFSKQNNPLTKENCEKTRDLQLNEHHQNQSLQHHSQRHDKHPSQEKLHTPNNTTTLNRVRTRTTFPRKATAITHKVTEKSDKPNFKKMAKQVCPICKCKSHTNNLNDLPLQTEQHTLLHWPTLRKQRKLLLGENPTFDELLRTNKCSKLH